MSADTLGFGVFAKLERGRIVRIPCSPLTTVEELRRILCREGHLKQNDGVLFRGQVIDCHNSSSSLQQVGVHGEQMVTIISASERQAREGLATHKTPEASLEQEPRSKPQSLAIEAHSSQRASAECSPKTPSRDEIENALNETGMALSEMDLDPRNTTVAFSPPAAARIRGPRPRSHSTAISRSSAQQITRSRSFFEAIASRSSSSSVPNSPAIWPTSPSSTFDSHSSAPSPPSHAPLLRSSKSMRALVGRGSGSGAHASSRRWQQPDLDPLLAQSLDSSDFLKASSGSWSAASPDGLGRISSAPMFEALHEERQHGGGPDPTPDDVASARPTASPSPSSSRCAASSADTSQSSHGASASEAKSRALRSVGSTSSDLSMTRTWSGNSLSQWERGSCHDSEEEPMFPFDS